MPNSNDNLTSCVSLLYFGSNQNNLGINLVDYAENLSQFPIYFA